MTPTEERWSQVTPLGVVVAPSLALLMGICDYLGFHHVVATTLLSNPDPRP